MKQKVIHIILGFLAIVAASYGSFNIPISETGIPFTLQSLVVFIVAGLLSWDAFFICILLYLCVGVLGAPVFADGESGLRSLMSPSGGFLYGFAFAGLYIAYFIKQRGTGFIKALNVYLEGTIILFFFGMVQLTLLYDFESAVAYGLKPFWKMALVKAILAAVIYQLIKVFISPRLS